MRTLNFIQPDRVLSTREAAELLGVSRSRFSKLKKRADFPRPHFLSTKRRNLYLQSDLLAYIQRGSK